MRLTRRQFVKVGGAGLAGAALVGCDDAVTEQLASVLEKNPGAFQPPRGDAIDLETHVLNRCAFGLNVRDEQRIRSTGVDAWLDEQLQPETINDRSCNWRCMGIESIHLPAAEMYECNEQRLLYDLTRNKILRAVYSKRQLFEVMVDHWTDQFNIVAFKQDCRWLKPAEDRDVIRTHALGRFRDLVRASATSAAMLIYLDGHDNKVIEPDDQPNENYSRELLELHTMGVGSGYTQRDILEVARCLSGWTYTNRPFQLKAAHVAFDASRHDNGEKEVLGEKIPAGGGADDLERVLDIVCSHPATAEYQATRLCRRFVCDAPPKSVLNETAEAFTRSDGDIAATVRALLSSTAFRDPDHRGALLKRPFEYVISALRVTDASTDGRQPIMDALERMGHAPHQYPTPDGYPMEQAPWLGTLLWRWKFAMALARGELSGTDVGATESPADGGGVERIAACAWGRVADDAELELLLGADGLALTLAAPAFMHR